DNLTEYKVTYDQLLRMTSGIGINEDGSGKDKNSIMLLHESDAASYASSQELISAPDIQYAYTGGGPVVLAREFIRLAGDGDPSKAYRFLEEKLISPLGLSSLILETDGKGTFLGSSFMSASAQDWAKLGQLYLQNGAWEGQRILPSDWSSYVAEKTDLAGDRDYGAGFWVATDGSRDRELFASPIPRDTFFMHGMMNQAVFIIPSDGLVIVRLGATHEYRASGEWDLVTDVLSAIRQ
ncbi:MAG: serine hydrolase, partial [Pseudomonadota bacterium]